MMSNNFKNTFFIPFLKIFNETAKSVDQGGGKRKGSFAIYVEPWHADIFDFLDLKKNHGKEEQRGGYYRGKPEGDWKWTYHNGQTWREESFIEGLEEGLAIEYNDTGKVVSKGN